ncbi:hypothetical protein [Glaciibacter psychrotolerans]|uniref:Uncharacterized protein n=1 Tax=Glaciibacter psychrotolerans TaxID=670054 RepID=A0A7Z0EEG4_9MICO|nr:hypothetical protein [Leifsonia psychrotolerans]NYJ20157.1 hypothetical protein [Leifsonia psychrotolerans]
MTVNPLDLPAKHTVLLSFAGHLEGAPDDVYAALAKRLASGDERGDHFLADPAERFIVVQGDWWYRGEYRVLPEGDASRIEYEIVNVAQIAHWAGALAGGSVVRAAPGAFQRLLTDVEATLDRD